jgi:transcriptional regulator with XRE-family HTH domain
MALGTVLRQAREVKKLSQEEVALALQVSQKTYANYESDKTMPSIQSLVTLGSLLEIDVLKVLQNNGITFNQTGNEFKDNSTGIINQIPDKLIAQYEARLKEKDEQITWLKQQINRF